MKMTKRKVHLLVTGVWVHFNVMSFGLANVPGVFLELVSFVLLDQEYFALACLYYILIFSDTMDDHLKHRDSVLRSFRKHNIRLKIFKCEFFLRKRLNSHRPLLIRTFWVIKVKTNKQTKKKKTNRLYVYA